MQLGSLIEADDEADATSPGSAGNDIPSEDSQSQHKLLLRAQEHVKIVQKYTCMSCEEPNCIPLPPCTDALQVTSRYK